MSKTEKTTNKGCYSVADIEKILGVSRHTVYRLIGRNLFETVILDHKYRIKKSSFDAWLNGDK